MNNQNSNNLNDPQAVVQIARKFENLFRDPKDKFKLKKSLTPINVLSELDFKKINFSDLNSGLQKALKKKGAERWYGHPIGFDGKVNLSNLTIMRKNDGSVLYFFRKNKDESGRTTYACSRLAKMDNVYCVEQIHNNFNIGEIIPMISSQEIISNVTMTGRHCGLKYIEIPL
jgi:hypothetical protein